MNDSENIAARMGSSLVALQVESYQRIQATELDLSENGQVVFLAGKNGAGKSSHLEAINALFGGKKETSEKPVRHGKEESKISAVTDAGFRITRVIKADGSTKSIIIAGPDGSTYKRHQELLDAFYSAHTRDALAFMHMKGSERILAMQQVLGIDFTEANAKIAGFKEARKGHNKTLEYLKPRLAAIPVTKEPLPTELLNSADLIAHMEKVRAHHSTMGAIQNCIDSTAKEMQRLTNVLSLAKADLRRYQESMPAETVESLQLQLSSIDATNNLIRANQEAAKVTAEIQDLEGKVFRCNETINTIEEAKAKKLSQAKFPVPGIAFAEDDITVNGIPFEQEATSKKIITSIAIAARTPSILKTLLIRDANLLDEDSMAVAVRAVKEEKCQAIMEIIKKDDAQGLCFVIENGSIAEVVK